MRLDSIRELKQSLAGAVLAPVPEPARRRGFGLAVSEPEPAGPAVALGAAPRSRGDFLLAVRLQHPDLEGSPHVEEIRRHARGEVEVRFVGAVRKRAAKPWFDGKTRPLRIGISVGHFKISAGTLGCFVRPRAAHGRGAPWMLSNNHVLANENSARAGDAILQPGPDDGGRNPEDAVARLVRFVRLKRSANRLDCAAARLNQNVRFRPRPIEGIGNFRGLASDVLDAGARVAKFGATTGVTRGKVTAIELDDLVVGYDFGDASFHGQIEIEGAGKRSFDEGGDSGSLIVNRDQQGVALLFAGSEHGGHNRKGLCYANPLPEVLDALKVDLVF